MYKSGIYKINKMLCVASSHGRAGKKKCIIKYEKEVNYE